MKGKNYRRGTVPRWALRLAAELLGTFGYEEIFVRFRADPDSEGSWYVEVIMPKFGGFYDHVLKLLRKVRKYKWTLGGKSDGLELVIWNPKAR